MPTLRRCLLILTCSALLCTLPAKGQDARPGSAPNLNAAEIDRLIGQLGSDDFDKREAASQALEAIGPPALDALLKAATKSDDAEVRMRADKAIQTVGKKLYVRRRCFEGSVDGVFCLSFSPDGKQALSGDGDGTVRLWDVETGKELHCFDGHKQDMLRGKEIVWCVVFSPNGRQALSGGFMGMARLWDLETGKELHAFSAGEHAFIPPRVVGAAFSPDGKTAFVASAYMGMWQWDVETGKELRYTKYRPAPPVWRVVFSPDGKRAMSGNGDYEVDRDGKCVPAGVGAKVRLWDVEMRKELRCLEGHQDSVLAVAFSPDGKRGLSGGADKTIRLWDLETGKELHCFQVPEDMVMGVAFSPDGKRALSSSVDTKGPDEGARTVRLWDVETRKELRCFENAGPAAAFSPDGNWLLMSGADKTLCLWQLSTE